MNINTSIFTMKKYRLKDIATVEISSVDKKTKESETNVRLCNFTDVYYNWAITKDKHDNFMEATANNKEISRFLFKKGQVALTKDSETRYDIGLATYIADDFEDVVLGYHCALITPDESKVVGCYLNAFLHSNMSRKYFANSASGSGQRYTLSIQTIEEMPILLPEIEEQKQIGKLFSNIDRKIEINRSLNHNLEAMAKQLYDYWFVQFDFPDENGKPYKSSGGLMVWNNVLKREIPATWKVVNIFDAVNVRYGFPFATENFTEEVTSTPIVRIRDILEGTVSAYSLEETDDKYKLQEGDLLVGMDGNFHMNYWHDNTAYLNQRCVRFRMKEDSSISAIQTYYNIQPYIKAKEKNAKGSTVGHLSDKDLKELYVIDPQNSNNFHPRVFFDTLLTQMVKNKQQILELIKQRDELLPLLMNGQVSLLNCD